MEKDPFGYALWKWQQETVGIKDAAQLETFFQAYAHGSVDQLASKLKELRDSSSVAWVTTSSMQRLLTLLALRDRKIDMLRFLMHDGQANLDPSPTRFFTDMANDVDKASEPEVYEIIEQSKWKRCQGAAWRNMKETPKKDQKCGAPRGTAGFFDYW